MDSRHYCSWFFFGPNLGHLVRAPVSEVRSLPRFFPAAFKQLPASGSTKHQLLGFKAIPGRHRWLFFSPLFILLTFTRFTLLRRPLAFLLGAWVHLAPFNW